MFTKDHDGREVAIPSPIWKLQIQSAPNYCGPTYHWSGREVADRPVHQHCTAEGICK